MSLISELREIIKESVKNDITVSGIEVVGHFDWKWHTIPTLNQFRQAVKNISHLQITKDERDILQFSINPQLSAKTYEISEADIQLIYKEYKKRLKQK